MPAQRRGEEFAFTDDDFQFVRRKLREVAGISLSAEKRSMVYARLSRRIRALGLDSFKSYRAHLDQHAESEAGPFVNALTTNLTKFFREAHHFEHLRDVALPSRRKNVDRVRIWSAGCSTGEEPYSIAIVLDAWLRGQSRCDARILATDLDTNVLERAATGRYSAESAASVSQWSNRAVEAVGDDRVVVADRLKRLITFKPLNLMHDWPMRGPFDAIFCRNVMIYFDRETQKDLIARMRALIADDGFLYVGHSETL
ncbi:MAG: protein-glutamate O-methyltransferase CheR [Pseudomonadota bacterium]